MKPDKALIFELSRPGRAAYSLPECDVPELGADSVIPAGLLRAKRAELPEVYEVRRHPALHGAVPPQLRRGQRLLSARLLHDEV
jgi:Glycine cleavage system protein P (pyridoxal-binding), C-terminal domain